MGSSNQLSHRFLTPGPIPPAAAQVAEVGALRKVAAVLALAGAMDQRAVLERAAEAGRRRFVRGLVDEVRPPDPEHGFQAILCCGPRTLGPAPGTVRSPYSIGPSCARHLFCILRSAIARLGGHPCKVWRLRHCSVLSRWGAVCRQRGRCPRCARWVPCWRRARARALRATWPQASLSRRGLRSNAATHLSTASDTVVLPLQKL